MTSKIKTDKTAAKTAAKTAINKLAPETPAAETPKTAKRAPKKLTPMNIPGALIVKQFTDQFAFIEREFKIASTGQSIRVRVYHAEVGGLVYENESRKAVLTWLKDNRPKPVRTAKPRQRVRCVKGALLAKSSGTAIDKAIAAIKSATNKPGCDDDTISAIGAIIEDLEAVKKRVMGVQAWLGGRQ